MTKHGIVCNPLLSGKYSEKQYEVIDGQQRLTTIYLILYYLNQRLAEEYREKLFELDYETRKDCPHVFSRIKKR